MREILFRGKRKDNGKWVYGLITRLYNKQFENLPAEMKNEDGIIGIEVDYNTVGQYTGLTDKSGTKIFEGDVLRLAYRPREDVIVEWDDGSFILRRVRPQEYYYNARTLCCGLNVKELKIIGNIYDNPEMLEVES